LFGLDFGEARNPCTPKLGLTKTSDAALKLSSSSHIQLISSMFEAATFLQRSIDFSAAASSYTRLLCVGMLFEIVMKWVGFEVRLY